MRYVLDFGSANAGGVPTFSVWEVLSSLTPAAPPAITEIGYGQYRFDYAGNDTIVFKSVMGGVELYDVISPSQTPGIRYALDFGLANAGGSPSFSIFSRLDTGEPLTQPGFMEIGSGLYAFDYSFGSAPTGVTDATYKASLAGVERSGVISAISTGSRGKHKTAGTIINRAAVQVGLAAFADPYSSTDANAVLLRELLETLGQELVSVRDWSGLVRDASIVTVAGQTSYPLPDDYDRLADQTAWNRSTTWPMSPVSQRLDQELRVLSETSVTRTPFRLQDSTIALTADPGVGTLLVLRYLSRNWVIGAGSTGADREAPEQSADVPAFDPLLLIAGLKHRWLEAKGFDTTASLAAYADRLTSAKASDTAGRPLSLEGGPRGFRFVDEFNLPSTVRGF